MLERLARDKPSSILRQSVNCVRKKFYYTGPYFSIESMMKKQSFESFAPVCRDQSPQNQDHVAEGERESDQGQVL
jgi:hypothetical protein